MQFKVKILLIMVNIELNAYSCAFKYLLGSRRKSIPSKKSLETSFHPTVLRIRHRRRISDTFYFFPALRLNCKSSANLVLLQRSIFLRSSA